METIRADVVRAVRWNAAVPRFIASCTTELKNAAVHISVRSGPVILPPWR